MLTLYGNSQSPPCNKVRSVCELLGLEYEWKELDFRSGEMKKPEFLALHPAGKVPAIDDDGFRLFESEAIIRYLAEKHGSAIYPGDLQERALVEQWSYFALNHVGLAMSKVYFNRVVAPKYDLEVDERSMREGREWLERYLPIVEAQLARSTHIAGPELTIADITLLTVLALAPRAGIDLSPYAKTTAWLENLRSQPFFEKTYGAS